MQTQLPEKAYDNMLFSGLSADEVERILPCSQSAVRCYKAKESVGEDVCSGGEIGVVLEGTLSVYGPGETLLSSIGKGELLGETLFSCKDGRTLKVVAETAAQVLCLSGAFFLMQCAKDCANKETHQQVVRNMLRLLFDRTAALNRKIAYLTAEDLRMKISMYLRELYELNDSNTFVMPLNRDRLAAYFAVARPSLSRELAGLKNQGIIEYHRSNVTILDLPALYRIADGM